MRALGATVVVLHVRFSRGARPSVRRGVDGWRREMSVITNEQLLAVVIGQHICLGGVWVEDIAKELIAERQRSELLRNAINRAGVSPSVQYAERAVIRSAELLASWLGTNQLEKESESFRERYNELRDAFQRLTDVRLAEDDRKDGKA
jgi:hypothetical protein